MSKPKKSLLACVSVAALVASFGFVQAQSPDEGAYPNANVNGTIDHGMDPRAYPADRLPANNNEAATYDTSAAAAPGDTAAPVAPSDPSVATAPDPVMTAAAPSPGYQRDVGVDGTPCIPEGSVGQKSSIYDPAVSTCPTSTTTAVASSDIPPEQASTTAAAPAPAESNLTVSDAPATRIDLSPPSEPLYNLPEAGMRAPRPDRN